MAISRFAGNFNALDFAYGVVGGAPALQVTSGSTSTGAYTLTCSPATIYTSGGIAVPISTATPINVGADSGFDTSITPTSVSQSGLNQLLITATFTFAHGAGAQVSSATYGLAEAILAVSKYGGGTVTVDAAWFKAGGTQALVTAQAATLPTGVRITNSSASGGGIQTSYVALTLAQIQAAFTTPVQIVPAPGAGSFVDINDVIVNYIFGSAAYTGGGVIQLSYGTGVTVAATTTLAATVLTSQSTNELYKLTSAAVASTTNANYLNKAINYTNATANFAVGTGGSGLVVCSYKIITGLA